MKFRWWIGVVIAAAALIALVLKFVPRAGNPAPENARPGISSAHTSPHDRPALLRQNSNALVLPVISITDSSNPTATNVPTEPNSLGAAGRGATALPALSDIEPAIVMENMRTTFRNYAMALGGNPVGTNPEITRALNGGNPKQIRFLTDDAGLRINNQGELVDAWGTPFFFHQLSAREMEIRSAGPDRKMWTNDDLVIK